MLKQKRFLADKMTDGIDRLRDAMSTADAVLIGAGAGLSVSAGFTYAGKRFDRYFDDFARKYHFQAKSSKYLSNRFPA